MVGVRECWKIVADQDIEEGYEYWTAYYKKHTFKNVYNETFYYQHTMYLYICIYIYTYIYIYRYICVCVRVCVCACVCVRVYN